VGCERDGGNKAERQIQQKVLQLLQQVGPINYHLLLLQFDLHNGYLHDAVGKLLQDKHVQLDSREMVFVTDAGSRLLDDMKHWSDL
jgi:hypothetical protein